MTKSKWEMKGGKMTTSKWEMTGALFLVALLFACTSSAGSNPEDVGDSNSQETIESGCSALGQEACEASDECEPYLAGPAESACLDSAVSMPAEFFGCHELILCSMMTTWAHPAEEPDDWHLFSDTCLPDGWVAGEREDACGVSCDGMDEGTCQSSTSCEVIEGWPMPQACLVWQDKLPAVQPEFAACREAEEQACPASFGWAHAADQPDEVWLFSDLCFPDGWVGIDGDPCAPACPEVHPWLSEPQSWKCDLPEGTVCSWSAEGCESGQKPDNVCTCVEYSGEMRFECERPFHNCLPLKGSDVPVGTLTRPMPEHRETGDACGPEITSRADVVCDNARIGIGNPENECTSDSDCVGKWSRCLDSWVGGGDGGTLCKCQTADCLSDADCGTDELCRCGITSEAEGDWCGGPLAPGCMHQCIPASCQTDDDCPGNQLCTPSKGVCQYRAGSYHCHDPEASECFSNWECMGEDQWGCNFEKGTGWVCQQRAQCD